MQAVIGLLLLLLLLMMMMMMSMGGLLMKFYDELTMLPYVLQLTHGRVKEYPSEYHDSVL